MIDVQVAYDKLASFESADDIACFFKGYGVTGIPNKADTCAISKWLQDVTESPNILVTGKGIFKDAPQVQSSYSDMGMAWDTNKAAWRGDLTKPMCDFINRFDHKMYPDLIDPDWEEPVPWSALPYDVNHKYKYEILTAEPLPVSGIEWNDEQYKYPSAALQYSIVSKIKQKVLPKFTDIGNC